MKSPSSPGATPSFALLAGHVHLDQHLRAPGAARAAQRRLRGDRVDQAHVRRDVLDLAALERADEVPGEQVAVLVLLGQQVLGAVLAHQLDAGLGERGQVVGRTYLIAAQDLDLAGRSARARARGSRARAGVNIAHHEPRLAAGDAVVAAVGEEEVLAAARAEVDVLDLARRPPPRARAAITARRSSMRPSATPSSVGERLEHLLADLVAAAADAGPDRGRRGARRSARRALLDDPAGERRASRSAASPPARRRQRDRVGSRPRARAGPGRARAVRWPSTRGSSLSPGLGVGALGRRRRPTRAGRCRAPASPSRRARLDAGACREPPRFSRHPLGSSSVRMPRLSDS